MGKATDVLRTEHVSIRAAVEVLEEFCFLLRADQDIIPEDITALTDFMRHFTQEVHQKKEELLLLPALEARGVGRDETHFAMLMANHQLGAAYIGHLVEAGRHSFLNRDEFIEAGESYIKMELAHIDEEEGHLLPLADERLSDADQEGLAAAFLRHDHDAIGQDRLDVAEHILEYFRLKYMENND